MLILFSFLFCLFSSSIFSYNWSVLRLSYWIFSDYGSLLLDDRLRTFIRWARNNIMIVNETKPVVMKVFRLRSRWRLILLVMVFVYLFFLYSLWFHCWNLSGIPSIRCLIGIHTAGVDVRYPINKCQMCCFSTSSYIRFSFLQQYCLFF
jgi:hypothetical protein